ncbi:MAG: mechanosensitive ion channel family protein [Calditrichae bacterium]|nr:mechanosensitive ion channel family protein [Calditrichia bacterium]
MENILNWDFKGLISVERIGLIIRVLVMLIAGMPLIYILSRWSRRFVTKKLTAQRGMITGKIVNYTGQIIIIIMALRELGFELTPLLGAAGILGIAIGFASQTSVSNVISGIFLIGEQPFVVGDVIRVGQTIGEVLSIDILSVKLRTFDNQFVRIPNENILKSEVVTLTRFPIRRADLLIGVAYKEDIARVREILMQIAHDNPLCLQEPAPLIIFEGFGTSSIDLKFAVWAAREDWLTMRNEIYEEIKIRFDREGIEIPFPHVSVYKGAASEPFNVKVVDPDNKN